ncbi:MAG: TrkA family potassium uptake protein [Solirubrobacterales bacterium]|nr:TrkA family potassium uptake protein [Solirubrobacterales bacterium]
MAERHQGNGILVLGLGRFGGAIAETLVSLGHEVLAADADHKIVQSYAGRLTHVVELDTTSEDALRQIGAADFSCAVVAIGTQIEASILTVSVLVDLGIETIWAKAISPEHGRILERVGATRVVLPEHEMGERVAHLVAGRALNYIEFDDGFALVETKPPREYVGKTLGDAGIRKQHGVTVVCIKRRNEDFSYATADTVIGADDLLIVAGKAKLAERFAARS